MSEINWDVELKKIEREYVGLPPEPTPEQVRAKQESKRRAREQEDAANARIGAGIRLLLVTALAGALYFWPYARDCGGGLFGYMAAEASIAVGALWTAQYTWRHRLGKAHSAAFVLFIGALAMLAVQILPRVGYAKVGTAQAPQWWCPTR